MQNLVVIPGLLIFLALFQAKDCSQRTETNMNEALVVKVSCKDDPQCRFEGKDLFITITISNKGSSRVSFPLEFVKERGPIIELTDTETGAETNLPTHPADSDLLEVLTPIEPGGSISMEWVMDPDELTQFGHKYVDLSAKITIMADILIDGKTNKFIGSDTIRVVSKDKPEDIS